MQRLDRVPLYSSGLVCGRGWGCGTPGMSPLQGNPHTLTSVGFCRSPDDGSPYNSCPSSTAHEYSLSLSGRDAHLPALPWTRSCPAESGAMLYVTFSQ